MKCLFKESKGSERFNMIQEKKRLTQHVQDNAQDISPAKISQVQSFLESLVVLLRRINEAVPSPSWRSKQQKTPQPTAMSDLLAGRFLGDVSRRGELETKLSLEDDKAGQPVEDTTFPDQRARLFARLGIRSTETNASPEDIERLIASLSHVEEKQRINAAHTIADLYQQIPPEKQMHARINLILMTWRDASAYARIAAIKALASTKTPDVSEALQVALRDEVQDVRAAAARALGEIPGKTPVVALVSAALREHEHWSVRAAAIRSMGESGERAFLNTINRALEDEDDSVRVSAIHALAQVEGVQAAARLALIAQRERQPHIKHAAILELENLRADDEERHIERKEERRRVEGDAEES